MCIWMFYILCVQYASFVILAVLVILFFYKFFIAEANL
jgi:hypothetical protein